MMHPSTINCGHGRVGPGNAMTAHGKNDDYEETLLQTNTKLAEEAKNGNHDGNPSVSDDDASNSIDAIIDAKSYDPVLTRKMALVNSAIDGIGISRFQWKLSFLNGFGYAVDSSLIVCQSIANPAVQQEYGRPTARIVGIPLGSQVGLLLGAGLWGFSADIIGPRFAFQTSLFSCAIFVAIAGSMPGYISFAAIGAIYSAGAGGNYIIDTRSFLEFLPTSHLWLISFMAWWAVGYLVTGLLASAFMSRFNCPPPHGVAPQRCARADNMGWRYLHFTCGGLVLVAALARKLLVRMSHTRDEEVVTAVDAVAAQARRPHSLTLALAEGVVRHTELSESSRCTFGASSRHGC